MLDNLLNYLDVTLPKQLSAAPKPVRIAFTILWLPVALFASVLLAA